MSIFYVNVGCVCSAKKILSSFNQFWSNIEGCSFTSRMSCCAVDSGFNSVLFKNWTFLGSFKFFIPIFSNVKVWFRVSADFPVSIHFDQI